VAARKPLDISRELLEEFDHNARVSEYLIGILPEDLWRAAPPGGKARSIAGIVAHMQGVRRTFAKMGGVEPAPVALDRSTVTPAQALPAFRQSRTALNGLFRESLDRGEARIKGLPRRTVNMMIYLIQHDTHHRGQICMMARVLGHRLSSDDVMRIWGWKKLPEDD
jgi:uncharacterized damage-inducible protein DinB